MSFRFIFLLTFISCFANAKSYKMSVEYCNSTSCNNSMIKATGYDLYEYAYLEATKKCGDIANSRRPVKPYKVTSFIGFVDTSACACGEDLDTGKNIKGTLRTAAYVCELE